jgi:hypothetical protein
MSIAVFVAQNLEPKVEVSTVFWRFEYYKIGALFTKRITPVCEHRVALQPAWSESTKQDVTTPFPLSMGVLLGIASSALG